MDCKKCRVTQLIIRLKELCCKISKSLFLVKWKEQGKNEECHKIFDNPSITKLEISGLRNGVAYDFSFESGSRLRFGKPAHKKGIILDSRRFFCF
jgi:hypothetical protein